MEVGKRTKVSEEVLKNCTMVADSRVEQSKRIVAIVVVVLLAPQSVKLGERSSAAIVDAA